MEIQFLSGDEVQKTRPLWEEAFAEDSPEFTEYYFKNKAERNLTFIKTEAEQIISMLHLSPYFTGQGECVCYIVGVATKKEYRRQGHMDTLMREALHFLWEEGEPFTFLMPANPAYYTPYDFTYIYDKPVWKLNEAHLPHRYLDRAMETGNGFELLVKNAGHISVEPVREERMAEVSKFANEILENTSDCYMLRNIRYYEILSRELTAQSGALFEIKKEDNIIGLIAYTKEAGKPALQEVILSDEAEAYALIKAEEEKPAIMGRVLRAEVFMESLVGRGMFSFTFALQDEILEENSGVYRVSCEGEGQALLCEECDKNNTEIISDSDVDCKVTTAYLTAWGFGKKSAEECFEINAGKKKEEILNMLSFITVRNRVFINEIV